MAGKEKDYLKEGNGFIDITLAKPAKINGVEVAVLRMREPTVADMEIFQEGKGSEAKREIEQFGNLCDCTADDVRALSLRNYRRVQEAFGNFTS